MENIVHFNINQNNKKAHYKAWIGKQILDDSLANFWPSSLTFFND